MQGIALAEKVTRTFQTLLSITNNIIGSAVPNALQYGIDQWNSKSSTTKIKFVPVAAGQTPDLNIRYSENPQTQQNHGCGVAFTGIGNAIPDEIDITPGFLAAAVKDQQDGKHRAGTIMAHEIGHILGLKDAGTNPSSPTIMTNHSGSTCENWEPPTDTVLDSDTTAAKGCVDEGRTGNNISSASPDYPMQSGSSAGGGCYHMWWVMDTYECGASGCSYLGSQIVGYAGVLCY